MTTVLVIDDDEFVANSLRTILELEGFRVEVATTGRAGLAALAGQSFDTVVIDIFMPEMDGIETIRELRRSHPGLPIIAMSGFVFREKTHAPPDFLSMARAFGATQVLHKPFHPRELIEMIRNCLPP
ncbi:MAG: LuxR family transcriptional regulator [Alphaproteobacteria bacterium]|nr:MAG: LuxR family transcriptional regulator [Alphaproteobacteria bacterium]